MEKWDAAYSKSVVEIGKRAKDQKRVSMFAKLDEEKISSTVC